MFRSSVALISTFLLAAACAPAPAPVTTGQAGSTPPTAPTATPTTAPPAATPTPAAQPAAGEVRFVIATGSSEARFRVTEQLAGRNLPNDAVGATKEVSGTVVLRGNQVVAEQSRITVDMRTLRTDQAQRDNFIQRNTLETDRFPTATFVLREIRGVPIPLPTSGQYTFQLVGDLTIHGVTVPATWETTATFTPQQVSGQAKSAWKFADFNLTQPRVPLVLSIEDNIRLEIDFVATRAGT
ncbi:MAG: YceI family protein [Chloroflexota bacterium]|nr:YceI family protein [Dehalococcoidia bacterium]MDW8255072.1 YceI family protein [Chloroflexota bacterium]